MSFRFDDFFTPYHEIAMRTPNGASLPLFWFKRFYPFYKYVIPKLVAKNRPINVIETGSMHEETQGLFTLIMGDLIKNWTGGRLYTVDISKDRTEECKRLTENFSDVIEYVHSDSIPFLQDFNKKHINIDLLMLDSYDLDMRNPHPSMDHHLKELAAIYSSINDGTTIAIDDNLGPDSWMDLHCFQDNEITKTDRIYTKNQIIGKGGYVNSFLIANGWEMRKDLIKEHEFSVYCYEWAS